MVKFDCWKLYVSDKKMVYFLFFQYFPSNGFETAIYFDDVDYYNERQAMRGVYEDFMNSDWIEVRA